MKEIVYDLRFVIVAVIAIAIWAIFDWNNFKIKAYAIMLQAKSLAKDFILKSGQEQEDWVVKRLYKYLPKRLTVFISEESMRKVVHFLYLKAKDYLDNGVLDDSIK